MSGIGFAFVLLLALLAPNHARAQDLDKDKSGAKLFAATCVDCHRSARGLARGRMSLMLSLYLREHYTSSFSSAQTISAYLQSVDAPRGKPSRAGKAQPTTAAAAASPSALRPPATVPGR